MCWGCGGNHSLHNCSQTSDADKIKIREAKMAEWSTKRIGTDAKGGRKRQTHKVLRIEKPGGGSCLARIPAVSLPDGIPTLLD